MSCRIFGPSRASPFLSALFFAFLPGGVPPCLGAEKPGAAPLPPPAPIVEGAEAAEEPEPPLPLAPVDRLQVPYLLLQVWVEHPAPEGLDLSTLQLDVQLINLTATPTNGTPVWVSSQIVPVVTNFPLVVDMPYPRTAHRAGEEWGVRARLLQEKKTLAATPRIQPATREGRPVERMTVPLVVLPGRAP